MKKPVLYTQAGCRESAKVRAWLLERGTTFTERVVTEDPEAARALHATGVFATPLLVAGESKVLGFRVRALAQAVQENPPCPGVG